MDDGLLLRKYAEGRDAEAFAELVRRYAGMVYGTCLRITRNAHDAEDAAQESFLELARRAGSVQQAGPWLHGVAANKARNAVRDAATRNRHEEKAMPEPHEEPTWEDLCPQVDQAIEELPGELRDAVVQHFLRGQTQAQVAEALGVNQSTVSRRLEQAIGQLRDRLRKAGVAVSVAALGALLTQNASAAAPATLTAALGKIALAGVGKAGGAAAAASATAGVLGTAGGNLAVALAAVAAIVVAGGVVSQHAAKLPQAMVNPVMNKEDTMSNQSVNRLLLRPSELQNWRLTAWRPSGRMWALDNGVFHGFCSNTWVGHAERFADMVLECEVFYDGFGGGDICVRGDRDADRTWEHGYNFAIGSNKDRTKGRIILTNPKGQHEASVEFKTNKWTKLWISAIGGSIQAYVNPDERLSFVDEENRFPSGQICLSDQSCQKGDNSQCDGSGHVKFRNLVVCPAVRHEVKREGGKVWIEGVPAEKEVKGIWHFDGTPGSLRAILKFKGVEAKYLDDTIFAAIMGQPFRFWFSEDFASCLAYTHEAPLGVIAAETLGFDYVWHAGGYGGVKGDDINAGKAVLPKESVEKAWAEVKGLLASGNPVVVFGGAPSPDLKAGPSVVVGYDEVKGLAYFLPHVTWKPYPPWEDSDAECKAGIKECGYRARRRPDERTWIGSGFAPGQGMGGAAVCFFAFKDRVRTPTEQEVAVAILRRAIAIGRGDAFDTLRPDRKGGLKALDLLAATLRPDKRIQRRDPDWWFAMEGLAWPKYRQTATVFLSRCATDFGGFSDAQKVHLQSAARFSEESAVQFDALWKLFLSVGPLEEYEERVKTVETALSSSDFRAKAVEVIRQIRVAEESTIAEIEKAMAALGTEKRGNDRVAELAVALRTPKEP